MSSEAAELAAEKGSRSDGHFMEHDAVFLEDHADISCDAVVDGVANSVLAERLCRAAGFCRMDG